MASRALTAVTLAVTATCAAVGPAAAAAPTIERIPINETFDDEFLTEQCGVPVETTLSDFVAIRTFARDGVGPTSVFTVNITGTAVSGENAVRIKDRGADVERVASSGDVIQLIIGQVPFGFTGVLITNLTTAEVLHEPRDTSDQQLAEACAALTA